MCGSCVSCEYRNVWLICFMRMHRCMPHMCHVNTQVCGSCVSFEYIYVWLIRVVRIYMYTCAEYIYIPARDWRVQRTKSRHGVWLKYVMSIHKCMAHMWIHRCVAHKCRVNICTCARLASATHELTSWWVARMCHVMWIINVWLIRENIGVHLTRVRWIRSCEYVLRVRVCVCILPYAPIVAHMCRVNIYTCARLASARHEPRRKSFSALLPTRTADALCSWCSAWS